MSEEVDYDGDHISIPEDAFEKFQSSAAPTFENSDEFITLADIVPPQPLIPNFEDELNEIPYDNEVILASNVEDNNSSQRSNYNRNECDTQILDISGGSVGVENITGKASSSQSDGIPRDVEILNSNGMQRKVDVIHNEDLDMLDIGGQDFGYEQELIQDSVLSTTVGKHGSNETQQVDNNTNVRRTKRGRIPNTSKYPLMTQNDINKVATGKKRGRPKKMVNETQAEPDSTNSHVENSLDNSNFNETSNTENTSKKGRHKKSLVPQNKAEPKISMTPEHNVDNSSPKKKGRPRKHKIDESLNIDNGLNEKDANLVDNSNKTIENYSCKKLPKGKTAKVKQTKEVTSLKEPDDDDGDDISLSQLKQMSSDISEQAVEEVKTNDQTISIEQSPNNETEAKDVESTEKRTSKKPVMDDFEYNVDAAVKTVDTLNNADTQDSVKDSLLVEDTTKRGRRAAKKEFHYNEGSDEDPFANIESSEDEGPKRRKKGTKYYSDDEYIPGDEHSKSKAISSSSDSDINDLDDGDRRRIKRKKTYKKSDSSTPRKRSKKSEDCCVWAKEDLQLNGVMNNDIENDIESSLEPAVIEKTMKRPAEAWATSNEFENFIAQKIQGTNTKIKKVSCKKKTESTVTPIEIPVVEPKEVKKCVANSTQTDKTKTSSMATQTSVPYDIPMKSNIDLSKDQSEQACEFLNSVVRTTAELGKLMTQKSEDFMQKKINTDNVTDTFKMDYCVRKSFLLFKLAKHNLMQMEEDLAKQYDEFLKTHGLSSCREEIKEITVKAKDDDSDCEIVGEVPATKTNAAAAASQKTVKEENKKSTINPKTVFLNKELSIKIAKKPSAEKEKKIDIQTRHAVWINDSVMVKKIKPTQSFLAQDSRNKKPPDYYVTEKMVSDFFEEYYQQRVVSVCAPFVSPEWMINQRTYACHYFLKYDGLSHCNGTTSCPTIDTARSETTTNGISDVGEQKLFNPKSLFSLCNDVIHVYLNLNNNNGKVSNSMSLISNLTKQNNKARPLSLFQLCFKTLGYILPRLSSENDVKSSEKSESDDEAISEPLSEPISDTYNDPITEESEEEALINNPCEEIISSYYEETAISITALSLKTLCYRRIADLFTDKNIVDSDLSYLSDDELSLVMYPNSTADMEIKSLFSLCVEKIQNIQKEYKSLTKWQQLPPYSPESLKNITFRIVKHLLNSDQLEDCIEDSIGESPHEIFAHDIDDTDNFMINCVNTLSDEAFQKLEKPDTPDIYSEDEHDYDAVAEIDAGAEWVSQLQVQELRSCYTPPDNLTEPNIEPEVDETVATQKIPAIVKLEPIDDFTENAVDLAIVKTEPTHNLNEMTVIPESIVTKSEIMDNPDVLDHRFAVNTNGYDVETFESFVRTNKMMVHSMTSSNDEIFSQSALRIRRQHEPDFEEDFDPNMSLLEPLHAEKAKTGLMESSSDESPDTRKGSGRKKTEKKKRLPKKAPKNCKTKDIPPTKETPVPEKASSVEVPSPSTEKPSNNSELAILTRRMRERIRQEKKIDSSDSDSDVPLNIRKEKKSRSKSDKEFKNIKTLENNEIQCSNVDSTEKAPEDIAHEDEVHDFAGFSSVEQDEVKSFQDYMKKAFEKLVPDESNAASDGEDNQTDDEDNFTSVVDNSEPVELLECEPTMPIFDDEPSQVKKPRGPKKEAKRDNKKPQVKTTEPLYQERNGWHCYNIDSNDAKLYQDVKIYLEKLPESFVETYMEYQEITDKDHDDEEVDRLINLQSLNRAGLKDGKPKPRSKPRGSIEQGNDLRTSRSPSPAGSDHYAELTPSEDEGANVEDEVPPPLPLRSSENVLAKNLLMDDQDSDSDSSPKKVKEEPQNDKPKVVQKTRAGPKSKTKVDSPLEGDLMLTADKMMNKELTLLHAPVVLTEEMKQEQVEEEREKKYSPKEGKTRQRPSRSSSNREYKNDDDSSSEEEKQWVTTKEKLLKRMGKKEDASVDDAKRAKLVTEFIERRSQNDSADGRRKQGTRRMSKKKMLERQKQLRVLSKELFGENSIDPTHTGKKGATQLFKGRRNIRAVIDKKSLARSTVLANMEEFERKRRLTIRQSKLREILGCDEGVNVLVINNEVCLEYDFDEHQPVVSVHKFFTSVMKAHQYEGVKFMWDACFESIAKVEAGHPGGGCILAHCMGLGKTLQVLALLHTVLTHPRVGMRRVLVCCPLSTVLNWVDEIHKWLGPVTDKIKVFELSKLRKTYERAYQLEDWYNGGGIFIIGYELFRSLTTLDPLIDDIRPSILKKIRTALLDPGPDIIVCDEGHLLKNDCSVLAVAMSRVVTKRRIVLTGTPMQNNLREYYCMVNFIKPNLLGTYSEYSNRFENPIMNGQHRDSREEDIKLMKARTHILHKVLEGCLQRQEASVLYPYLPKKHEYTVFISLTKCQWDLYKHYLRNYTNYFSNIKSTKPNVLKDFHILQKIWSHPQVLHNFQTKTRDKLKAEKEKLEDDLALEDKEDIKPPETETWWLQYLNGGTMLDRLEASNKFVAVFKILHECVKLGDKVLIFSTSLSCLDALEYFLKRINDWNLGHDYYRLDGSVPAEVRQKWCREFNAEHNLKTKLFLISTRAGCLGLNMVAANRVIILDTSWNPAHDIQSIFRVYRFGQKKDCFIYRLVAMGTMEQKIYERSVTKQAVACRVVDEQQIDRHYNMADLNELYRFDESGSGVAGGVAVGVCDVALLRVARDAALHAVHEHDSLLRGGAEPALPEHERQHAWEQFQQEHKHKQMQNDIDQRNEEIRSEQIAQLSMEPVIVTATLPPAPTPPPPVKRGRGRPPTISRKIRETPPDDEMVRQITNILIQHDVTKYMTEPSEIAKLVTRVRQLVSSGGKNVDADDLTASIANVMLRDSRLSANVPPPLTDVQPSTIRTYTHRRKEARPSTSTADVSPPSPPSLLMEIPPPSMRSRKKPMTPPPISPVPSPLVDRHLPSNRNTQKRRAALVAENRFDASVVIDIDDDDEPDTNDNNDNNDDEWHQPDYEDDVYGEPVRRISPTPKSKPGPLSKKNAMRVYTKKNVKSTETRVVRSPSPANPPSPEPYPAPLPSPPPSTNDSILLSDDETPAKAKPAKSKPVPTTDSPDDEEVPLHPSLLGNPNFVKIVAHTYLAGNPMLDEDAAVLAAQYSILKTVKEAESTGKPIVNGPVYDIAVKVLGKPVIKKVYEANPQSKDFCAEKSIASTLQSVLGTGSKDPEPNPVPSTIEKEKDSTTKTVKKPKIGPKSKVQKPQLIEPKKEVITPQPPVQRQTTLVPFKIVNNTIQISAMPTYNSNDECILPDDEPRELPPAPAPAQTNTKVFTDNPTSVKIAPKTGQNVFIPAGRNQKIAPVVNMSTDTICLDSDDEETTTVPGTNSAPVPVALTGPNSQTLPLPYMSQTAQPITSASSRAKLTPVKFLPSGLRAPVPLPGPSLSQYRLTSTGLQQIGSNNTTDPVPISLSGPSQTVPVSLSRPNPSIIYPMPQDNASNIHLMSASTSQTSVANKSPIVFSTSRNGNTNILTLKLAPSDPLPPTPSPIVSNTSVTAPASNIILMPKSKKKVMQISCTESPTAKTSSTITTPTSSSNKTTVCKPGDIFRISKTGQVEVLHMANKDHSEDVSQTEIQIDKSKKSRPVPQTTDPPKILNHVVDNIVAAKSSEPVHTRTVSSSDSSRSPSPNPLDILKNVVVIQAPKSDKPHRTATPEIPNKTTSYTSSKNSSTNLFKTTTKETPKNVYIKRNPSKTSTPSSDKTDTTSKYRLVPNTNKSATSINKNTSSSKGIAVLTKNPSSSSKNTSVKTPLNESKSTPSTSKTASSNKTTARKIPITSKAINITSVDLTDVGGGNKLEITQTRTAENRKLITIAPSTSKNTKKTVDSKKSISNTVDLTSQGTSNKGAPVKKPILLLKPKTEKRPAPVVDTSAAKKKKTECKNTKVMTLKDFDIDDIDDIIELD